MQQLNDLIAQYVQRFGKPPLNMAGVSDELLAELIEEALQKGREIPEDDYYRHLPRGADA